MRGGGGYLCKASAAGDAIEEQGVHNHLEHSNQFGIRLQLVPVQNASAPAHRQTLTPLLLDLICVCWLGKASCMNQGAHRQASLSIHQGLLLFTSDAFEWEGGGGGVYLKETRGRPRWDSSLPRLTQPVTGSVA